MSVTHIFFDLHDTLVDPHQLNPIWSRGLGVILSRRYGKSPKEWEDANQQIISDWDSYWADLNLRDDDGIDQLWEGWFRVHRALFRLTHMPEPSKAVLTALSREILASAPAFGNAFYTDASAVVRELSERGYQLGVVTHAVLGQADAILRGAEVRHYFNAPLVTPDITGRFDKDTVFFRTACDLAGVAPERCLVIDDKVMFLQSAQRIGMQTAHLNRHLVPTPTVGVDHYLADQLGNLLAIVST